MTLEPPRLTVLMPVYNGMAFLRPALESILAQTFRDFEFVIVDDGSTDQSAAIIASYPDPRIRVLHLGKNLGLSESANRGMEVARGTYVARMDCDDISVPTRLAKQVRFLDTHPTFGVVGSWAEFFGDRPATTVRYPVRPARVEAETLFRCSLAHPTVMFRRSFLVQHGLRYDPTYPIVEDWALWSECRAHFPMANIPQVLVRHRVHHESCTTRLRSLRHRCEERLCLRNLAELGVHPTGDELALHLKLGQGGCTPDPPSVARAWSWLECLQSANRRSRRYPEAAFGEVLGQVWYRTCWTSEESAAARWRRFLASPWVCSGLLGNLLERQAAARVRLRLKWARAHGIRTQRARGSLVENFSHGGHRFR